MKPNFLFIALGTKNQFLHDVLLLAMMSLLLAQTGSFLGVVTRAYPTNRR